MYIANAEIPGDRTRAFRLAPQRQSYELSIASQPQDQLSGDYADAIPLPNNRLFICLADVCGKGPQAAAIAQRLRVKLRQLLAKDKELGETMICLNKYLRDTLHSGMYVTMFAGVLHTDTGGFQYANAGHPSPLVLRGDSTLDCSHGDPQLPLGIESLSPSIHTDRLLTGDLLVLYSDGCADPTGYGAPLSTEALGKLAASTASQVPHATLAGECLTRLRRFEHRTILPDDRTLLLLRVGLPVEATPYAEIPAQSVF